ncbi:TPA: gp53-like domain-containing protein [Yersinia enterocolitica]
MRNTASLGESGWHRDAATGTIRQWGRTPAFGAGAGFLINFPIPFPTKIVSVNGILIRPGNTSTGSAETLYIGEPSSLTSVRMYHGGSETYPALWEVEGY